MHLLVQTAANDGSFHGPSIDEFFPAVIAFAGTPFELNRIMLVRFFAVIVLIVLFWIGTRNMRVVPRAFQSLVEMGFDFVRVSIAEDLLGRKDGRRFLPILTSMFFMILFMNLTGVIPGLNTAGTSVIGTPIVLAIVAYVTFVYAGIKKHPGGFFKNSLFPAGVPWPFYILITPIEFFSTFILRPITLVLRLTFNMIAGHLLLVLFFSATQYFLFTAPSFFKLFGVGTLAFGFVFTLFEVLVAVLQAYIFTILTTVYIQLALAEEH